MKNRKTVCIPPQRLFPLFALSCTLFAAFPGKGCDMVRVRIAMEDSVFLTRRPVWVDIDIVQEEGNGPPALPPAKPPALPRALYFVIEDEDGNRFRPERCEEGDVDRLERGSVIRERVNVIAFFYRIGMREPWLEPGRYRVRFEWQEPGRDTVRSGTLEFRVDPPGGRDRKAFELLAAGDRHYRLKNLRESDRCYSEAAEKYPESVYAPAALELLLRNHVGRFGAGDIRIRESAVRKLLESYPDGDFQMGRALQELEEIHRYRGNIPALTGYLRRLRSEHPGTRLYKMTGDMLERLERE